MKSSTLIQEVGDMFGFLIIAAAIVLYQMIL